MKKRNRNESRKCHQSQSRIRGNLDNTRNCEMDMLDDEFESKKPPELIDHRKQHISISGVGVPPGKYLRLRLERTDRSSGSATTATTTDGEVG